jgi:serine/threonine protein kinase
MVSVLSDRIVTMLVRDYSQHPLCLALATLNDYHREDKEEGYGSFGTVYPARRSGDPTLDFVEKIVMPTEPASSEGDRPSSNVACQRTFSLLREIVAQYSVCHPCLVSLRGWNIDFPDIKPCIALLFDRLPGGDLEHSLCTLRSAEQRIVCYGLALAVQYLHTNGFMHRDIKPDNVLLDSNQYPRLTDLGYVKKLEWGCETTGDVGALSFRAPEVGTGMYIARKNYSYPADVFSLGMTFCSILNRAIWTDHASRSDRAIKNGARPDFRNDVNNEQRKLIQSMWNGNPEARPTIHEVVLALNNPKMWGTDTESEFTEFLNWIKSKPQKAMDMAYIKKCSLSLNVVSAWVTDHRLPNELPLSECLAIAIGFMTGNGETMNEEMKNRVVAQLKKQYSLVPDVFRLDQAFA